MTNHVITRSELVGATLHLGGKPIELVDYSTTGLRIVAAGPSGTGKTNAGLLVAEQLADQGWVSVLVDPEGECASMYGKAVRDAEQFRARLTARKHPILVVEATDASEFIPYAQVLMDVATAERKPIFAMVDECQIFSASKSRRGDVGEATDLMNQLVERGRKRALDLFVTAHRFSGSLHRSIFANRNLTLIGRQEDAAAWSILATQFRASKIQFRDLATLASGEFFCFSLRGVERIRMPMAQALAKVAPPAPVVQQSLPATFRQWDRAMRSITTERLHALEDPELIVLLSTIAGLNARQVQAGERALQEELEAR